MTAIALFDVPDAVSLNAQLPGDRAAQKELIPPAACVPTWVAGGRATIWKPGAVAIRLLAFARNVANRMTTDREEIRAEDRTLSILP